MRGVSGCETHKIPYAGGYFPGFRLPAKGKEVAMIVFHGGYDSFVEEFYPFLKLFTDYGWTVLGFDGPDKVAHFAKESSLRTNGKDSPRPCSTISSWMPSTG